MLALEEMGVKVEYSHHEVGPSQHEIDMRFTDGLEMADNVMTYRTIVKEIAHKNGCYATFMPKPLFGENGSGMHVHQSLFRGDQNAFFDPDDESFLSAEARGFIAGLLRHAREISCVFCAVGQPAAASCWATRRPSTRPGAGATARPWCACRYHPARARHPGRVPLPRPRLQPLPDLAAMLHAGLDGIEKGYELPPPMERNLYDLTHEERERAGIEQLPESLGEAIELGASSELLLKAFGEHIHSRFVDLKRAEWDEYRVQVTPYEIERYLPLL